jgi:uroporphyrinogen-III decarboxylase
MTNLERFIKTINWEIPDRLMTYDFVDHRALFEAFGGDGDLIERNARMAQRIGLDVTRYVYDPEHLWMGAKLQNWIRFFGVDPSGWEVTETGGTAWISRRPFSDLRGLEKNMPNQPRKSEIEEWLKPLLKNIKQVYEGFDVVFIGAVEGPLTDAYTYSDMTLFCEAIYEAPELLDRLIEVCGSFSQYIAEMFAENPTAPLMFMGEDVAGSQGPIFSLDFIRQKALPMWKRIARPIKDKGFKFLYHTDGKAKKILPLVINELGADGFNPIERNGCNDIFEIRRNYPRTLLFGNVCCETTLPYGSPQDVEEETLELIERLGPQGGILIGSSSEVHDLVPAANALRMYQTVRKLGRYPLRNETGRRSSPAAGGG